MKRKYILTAVTAIITICLIRIGMHFFQTDYSSKNIKVGFVYIGDSGTPYTNNFIRSQNELEKYYSDNVTTIAKYNIPEDNCETAIRDLVDRGCSLIFGTSFGYGEVMKKLAVENPGIQFCQATCSNANVEPVLSNYHTFMGRIYQGRYISGIVIGMKLKELIDQKKITPDMARIGYVAAFPLAEVISGYTAFFLGVRSVVPEALMTVSYTNTWSNTTTERKLAEKLIDKGCIVIAQHSDTTGPATACETASTRDGKLVFHAGYNQTMTDVAPTTSLISTRINWTPYFVAATEAVIKEKKIESIVNAQIFGNDAGAGFEEGWCDMIGLNKLIAAPGTKEVIDSKIKQFKSKGIIVFEGNYMGVNPFDPDDIWNLRNPYIENALQSAPSFNYVLRDVISVE